MKVVLMITAIVITFGFSISKNNPVGSEWIAPKGADNGVNPFAGNAAATAEGKKIFTQICIVCHGEKGKGDGIGGIALIPKPGNFTLAKTQTQTDGALYWKMSEGRPPMASYKATLTPTQRWQLVNYIRTFKK